MTNEQLKQYKEDFSPSVICMTDVKKEDEYGVYSTGLFHINDKNILVTIDNGKWHLTISATNPISNEELKELRYMFLPDNMQVAQIFPQRSEVLDVTSFYHLWQL